MRGEFREKLGTFLFSFKFLFMDIVLTIIVLICLDYHYSTKEDMLRGIHAGEFIEHAEFSHNLYGTR